MSAINSFALPLTFYMQYNRYVLHNSNRVKLTGLGVAYEIKQISKELLEQTEKAWQLVVGVEEFASEFQAIFEWIGSHIDYDETCVNSRAYAIVDDGQKVASGFVEIVSTKPSGGKANGRLTKLLKVFVSPQYWEIAEHRGEVSAIFMAAINGVVKISEVNHSKTIKIYGRTQSLLDLLIVIDKLISSDAAAKEFITTCIKGRWLEISVKKGKTS